MINLEHTKKKYPRLAIELDTAKQLQDVADSPYGKMMYTQKQQEFNALIPELFTANKLGDESKLRYTITRMELIHDDIKKMQENSKAFDTLVEQIESGDFDKEQDDIEEEDDDDLKG